MRPFAAVAAAIVLAASGFACATPHEPLPPFALTNQSGRLVRAEDLGGRLAIVSFIFTGCDDVCPLVTSRLVQAQAEARAEGLASAVRFISITLDPGRDTPDVLQRYAARFGADTTTWDFLTGNREEIGRVARATGIITENDRGRLGHEGPVLVVNARGDIVRRHTDSARLAVRILDDIRHYQQTTR
jgi:protein SCO1